MKYNLLFRPEVEDDLISGYIWYEESTVGLGEEFLRLFYACVQDIPHNPFLYRKIENDFRRLLLRRFPYAIYFRIEEDQIIVFGLFHCARDPKFIQGSLNDRNITG